MENEDVAEREFYGRSLTNERLLFHCIVPVL
jgi:hypothetical protein